MKKSITKLPTNIKGNSFATSEGEFFSVLEGKYFPSKSVARQHRQYLAALREGVLVAVSFYGRAVPLITVSGGVYRLTRIRIAGEIVEGVGEISQRLHIRKTRQPMALSSRSPLPLV